MARFFPADRTHQYRTIQRLWPNIGIAWGSFFVNPGTVLTNIRTWCVSWYAEAALQRTCRLILGEIGASESPGGEFIFVCSVDCVTYLCLPLGTHNHATSVSRKKRASHERSVYTVNFSGNFRKKKRTTTVPSFGQRLQPVGSSFYTNQ